MRHDPEPCSTRPRRSARRWYRPLKPPERRSRQSSAPMGTTSASTMARPQDKRCPIFMSTSSQGDTVTWPTPAAGCAAAHRGNYLDQQVQDAAPLPDGAPSATAYRSTLIKGGTEDPLLPELKHHLAASHAADFAVAFTMRSGLDLLHPHLQDLLDREGRLRFITGDYLDATDPDALLRLLDLRGRIDCRVFQTYGAPKAAGFAHAFHPKGSSLPPSRRLPCCLRWKLESQRGRADTRN